MVTMTQTQSTSTSTTIATCRDILRRTDPRDTEKHLAGLATLISNDDVADQLHQLVHVPLAVGRDTEADGRKFLLCEHNRDGASHRSPWSNAFFPPRDDGIRPSERLRALELHANEVFDVYRALYYGDAASASSVYLWENGDDGTAGGGGGEGTSPGFAGCFLVQNRVDRGNAWTSRHVVEVGRVHEGDCTYTLTSTLLLSITSPPPASGDEEHAASTATTNISGSLTRHNVRQCKALGDDGGHVVHLGQFIEETESDMRSEMASLYMPRTKTVAEGVRREGTGRNAPGGEHASGLNEAVLAMAMNRKCAT